MFIGIDLDNTIINYDHLWRAAADKLFNSVPSDVQNKKDIKNYLKNRQKDEEAWRRVQSEVYGREIRNAAVFSGFKRFVAICNIRDIKMKIFSHKSSRPYSNTSSYDLREAAVRFLGDQEIISTDTEIELEFYESLDEKITAIVASRCDIFIDDLEEVHSKLIRSNFAGRQILFRPQDITSTTTAYLRCFSWLEIIDLVFGDLEEREFLRIAQRAFPKMGLKAMDRIKSGNNGVFAAIDSNDIRYALKVYSSDLVGGSRQARELVAYSVFPKVLLDKVPKVIIASTDFEVTCFEWIGGKKPEKQSGYSDRIFCALDFLRLLSDMSAQCDKSTIGNAKEACFSISDIQVQSRQRLEMLLLSDAADLKDLYIFAQRIFDRLIAEIKDINVLSNEDRILSPADFGFHNCLVKDGQYYWFDFEYFGWDARFKLLSELLWHPGFKLSAKEKAIWVGHGSEILGIADKMNRFEKWHVWFGFRWAMIILKPLVISRKDVIASKEIRDRRIQVAYNYLSKIESLMGKKGRMVWTI